ncbi:SusD/RagB family nutrient-binding outer membrane lipoprotein [Pedobacter caeni]|uniref:Starch-binding associating with outer membrane n=1 Tax=Pedobacter caeni TaxID=288992 RepID=A0A1M5MQ33_9SPHI|nr:SusD/RagB family nutrient-binding outer membrane lipoprotein [Pedobacter caeni]SHG79401.1 Starch-binding associating with outer membrane [Pedobacter caeni]
MKKYISKAVVLALVGCVALSSCKKFTDINTDPNQLLDADPTVVLPAAMGRIGFNMGSDIHRFTSLYVQQFAAQGNASSQPRQYDLYSVLEGDINNTWAATFSGTLPDLQKVIAKTDGQSPFYAGIAKILKGYVYAVHVDAYGDLPYTEATNYENNWTPKFDGSSLIYDKVFALLDEGIANVKATSSLQVPAADDLIYGGNMQKWERFANALKLRMYIHYFSTNASAADMAKAKAGIEAIISGNKLLSNNGDNFQFRFLTLANQTNPIHQFEGSRANQFFPSKTLVDLMTGKKDGRRAAYFTATSTTATDTVYKGATNGDPVESTAFSRMHTYIRGKVAAPNYNGEAPIRMLTFAEQNLILAEYYARAQGGNNLGTAQTYFTAAINASFDAAKEFSDVTTEGFRVASNLAAYKRANGELVAATALRQIIEEKFVSNYGVAVEPWSDWRRTGFPVLIPVSPATQLPRILPYSFTERSYNPNVPARASVYDKAVFWDK